MTNDWNHMMYLFGEGIRTHAHSDIPRLAYIYWKLSGETLSSEEAWYRGERQYNTHVNYIRNMVRFPTVDDRYPLWSQWHYARYFLNLGIQESAHSEISKLAYQYWQDSDETISSEEAWFKGEKSYQTRVECLREVFEKQYRQYLANCSCLMIWDRGPNGEYFSCFDNMKLELLKNNLDRFYVIKEKAACHPCLAKWQLRPHATRTKSAAKRK